MTSSASQWTAVIFLASVVFAGFAGYRAGQSSKLSSLGKRDPPPASAETHSGAQKEQIEFESDEEALADGDLASVQAKGPCKLASLRVARCTLWRN
jgi:hypothetical protein